MGVWYEVALLMGAGVGVGFFGVDGARGGVGVYLMLLGRLVGRLLAGRVGGRGGRGDGAWDGSFFLDVGIVNRHLDFRFLLSLGFFLGEVIGRRQMYIS